MLRQTWFLGLWGTCSVGLLGIRSFGF
uniref:Uncharacterized protein n=1 Tax=Solanum lycopersicum TaxID=4081 RepID=A0A3Q7G1W3_SOLLC